MKRRSYLHSPLRIQSSTVIAVLQIGLSVKCSLFNSHSVFFFFCFVNVLFICRSNWVRNHNKRLNEKWTKNKELFTDQNWMFKNFIATETNLTKYMNPLETVPAIPKFRHAACIKRKIKHYAQMNGKLVT